MVRASQGRPRSAGRPTTRHRQTPYPNIATLFQAEVEVGAATSHTELVQTKERAMVTTLAEILPHAARWHKDRIALIVEDRQFSFTQLDSMSNRVANGFGVRAVHT